MSTYTYSIATDFPNHKVGSDSLTGQIIASSIEATLDSIETDGDECRILFDRALTTEEETTLDGIVAAHVGYETLVNFRVADKVVPGVETITEPSTWQSLGGVAVNAQFYVPDLSKAFSIAQFSAKADGAGAQLVIIETDGEGETREMCVPFDMPDTDNEWQVMKFQTTAQPSEGDCTYELCGKLGAATSASVRYAAFAMIEVTVV